MTDGRLRRATQDLAAERFSLCLIETSRRGVRQLEPKVCGRRHQGVGLKSLACEAERLVSPRLGVLGTSLLGVDQREQPEVYDIAVGDLGRIWSLDGLQCDPPRL